MNLLKICNAFRTYLTRSEVKQAANPKLYKGAVVAEREFRSSGLVNSDLTFLDNFYAAPPANIKLFRMASVNQALGNFNNDLSSLNQQQCALEVYRNILYFISIVNLVRFWDGMRSQYDKVRLADCGIAPSVLSRIKIVQSLMEMSLDDIKAKKPDKATINFVEMGLRRILTMEVGTDDWDK